MNIEINEDVYRHKKKSRSNVSKASKKSNHKHEYEDVLIRTKGDKECLCLGKQCKICGNKQITKYFITEQQGGHTALVIDPERIKQIYPDLSIISLEE